MSKLRRASIILGILLWSGVLIDRSYNLGRDLEFNRLLWRTVTRTSPNEIVPPSEYRNVYESMKRPCILKTIGDTQ